MNLKSTILITVVLFASSCKKSDSQKEPDQQPAQKYISRIIEVVVDQPANTASFTNFTYDDQKRLISRKSASTETTYAYNGKSLFQIVSISQGIKIEYTLSYQDNGQVKEVVSRINPASPMPRENVYKYIYSGNKVVEIQSFSSGQFDYKYTYQYHGENAVKQIGDDNKLQITTDYTYDDKKTIYYGIPHADLIKNIPLGAFAVNNTLSSRLTYSDNPTVRTSSSVYTYDDDGYPITMVSAGRRHTYEYKEL